MLGLLKVGQRKKNKAAITRLNSLVASCPGHYRTDAKSPPQKYFDSFEAASIGDKGRVDLLFHSFKVSAKFLWAAVL